uniref:Uncharacterized protein n=2 Tax=Moniliophthora roreri TaxID=221103 RepID=A0A0W0EYM0_MONRR
MTADDDIASETHQEQAEQPPRKKLTKKKPTKEKKKTWAEKEVDRERDKSQKNDALLSREAANVAAAGDVGCFWEVFKEDIEQQMTALYQHLSGLEPIEAMDVDQDMLDRSLDNNEDGELVGSASEDEESELEEEEDLSTLHRSLGSIQLINGQLVAKTFTFESLMERLDEEGWSTDKGDNEQIDNEEVRKY